MSPLPPPNGGILLSIRSWLAILALAGCTAHDLRGRSTASRDGRTYLIIADDDGGQCGPIRVDGATWPHAIGERGAIRPGDHVISCGAEVTIHVDSGEVFRFDYWGP